MSPFERRGRDGEPEIGPPRILTDPDSLLRSGLTIVAAIRRLAQRYDDAANAVARPGEGMGTIKATIERSAADLEGSVRTYSDLLKRLATRD